MIEKVNPSHPDKIADRIAGAIVDLAYTKEENPKIAVEVLIGHGKCYVMIETTVTLTKKEITKIIERIAGKLKCEITLEKQDVHLS
ncbi:S-adenosylmethionine synthetase, partial [Streptococcus agalactiae]|nr:S-adenosylmethionine synthetase [Streptococcus agalactiae]